MADALISAPVAIAAGAVSVALIALSTKKVRNGRTDDKIALMGVMGAFVFVAQMINFTIPGTGSSGHIIGGILLSAMLGPWRGFLTLCSVLIVQCLVFADGGLLALGCNIINMAAMSCLVAYPLVYAPIVRRGITTRRLFAASVAASVVGLELGAFLVTVETTISGITLLPLGNFLMFMLPIHLVIGICEGVATGLVLVFVKKQDAMLLKEPETAAEGGQKSYRALLCTFIGAALALGLVFMWIASSNPDGLEWSIMKLTGFTELAPGKDIPTAILPGYESHLSGIIGGVIVMAIVWAISSLIFRKQRKAVRTK